MMQEAIDRRQFMKNSLALASCAVMPIALDHKPNSNALDLLIREINRQGAIYDRKLDEVELRNITYAYHQINPQNHLEYAVVTALHSRPSNDMGLIDEYARRKNGQSPKLFSHPIFDLKAWCVPDTYGLMIFREQELCLLQELTSASWTRATTYQRNLRSRQVIYNDLFDAIDDKYKKELGMQEIQDFFNFMNTHSPHYHYYWCSNIVLRAGL